MFGFLNIYKPKGMTSHDVVSLLRRKTGIKQIGHAGTLDPFAEGVLPVGVGKATRLIEYLGDKKEYIATVQLGAATTTYDTEGDFTKTCSKKIVKLDLIDAFENFTGEIEQKPPIYSAIKVNGKKLYEYARQGQDIDIQKRKVCIEKIELRNFDDDKQTAEILVRCSKGTYIRSLANDLGEYLDTGGYLTKLVRTQSGYFRIENAIQLENIDKTTVLINPVDVIDLPQVFLSDEELEKVKHGISIKNFNTELNNNVILVYNDNEICAIGQIEGEYIKTKKVFL